MATTKTVEKVSKTVVEEESIDISQFFSLQNEEDGVWFEAKAGSVPTGIEFLVYGPNSKKAWESNNNYQKALDALDDEADEEYKREESNALLIEAVASRCGDIRGKNGKKIMMGDREVNKNDIKSILSQSPLLATSILKFCQKSDGFLEKRKKN